MRSSEFGPLLGSVVQPCDVWKGLGWAQRGPGTGSGTKEWCDPSSLSLSLYVTNVWELLQHRDGVSTVALSRA